MSQAQDTSDQAPAFQYKEVKGRGRRKGRRGKGSQVKEPSLQDHLETLEEKRGTLRSSGFYTSIRDSILERIRARKPKAILCYGLGSPSSSRISRWQWALLTLLREDLSLQDLEDFFVYDPIFTEMDKQILEHGGAKVLKENEEGHRSLNQPTLTYMPHCDRVLYNALLQANWSPTGLDNLILLGNRLDMYSDAIPASRLSRECPSLHALTGSERIEYVDLPSARSIGEMDVFNDVSLHLFHPSPEDKEGEGKGKGGEDTLSSLWKVKVPAKSSEEEVKDHC
ncbi:MAG: SRR1-domain-containing protein [Piptocephalis tieghemiana]|nr:MAG: SRR1-domain-containing protein [Piptocephalis tieghemiana]